MFKYFFAAIFFFILIGFIASAQEKSKRKKRNSNRYKLEKKKAWIEEDKAKFGHLDNVDRAVIRQKAEKAAALLTEDEKKALVKKEKEKKAEPNLTEIEGKTYPIMNSIQRKKEANLTEEEKSVRDEKRRIAREKEKKKLIAQDKKNKKLLREMKAKEFLEIKEANKKRKEEKKKYDEGVLFLERKKIIPLRSPIDKTGDKRRYLDFIEECGNNELTNKYLYLVRIKSNIDDKKFIKIGVTSNENINERFEDDEVIDLIEVIRSEKLETKLAMAVEYSLIQKHRPKDYLAEEEFDVFSRFSGYTEVIPMRYTKEVSKDIDSCIKYSENILSAFKEISRIS